MKNLFKAFGVTTAVLWMLGLPVSAILPQSGERRVNTFTTDNQENPSIACDANGNFVVVWESWGQSQYPNIYGQRFNAAGVPQGGEFRISESMTGGHKTPVVAMDADGDFVVAWSSVRGQTPSYEIVARRYNAAGVAQGGEFQVNTYITDTQDSPSVAMDEDGDFVVVWVSNGQTGGGTLDVYGQRYNALGVPQGGEFHVNASTVGFFPTPEVAMNAGGRFVVTWTLGQSTVVARRYDAAGIAQGSEFNVGAGSSSSVGLDATGNFVITWTDSSMDGSGSGIFGQRYSAAGAPQGGRFRVNSYTNGDQIRSSVVMGAAGNFVVAWSSLGQDGDLSGVYAQRYDASGSRLEGEFRANTTTALSQLSSEGSGVALDAEGNFAVIWTQSTNGAGTDVYATKFFAVTKPVVITQVATDRTPTTATLLATVNPGGSATTVEFFRVFESGLEESLGTVDVPAGKTDVFATKPITGLAPYTTYQIKAVATNIAGTTAGFPVPFTTSSYTPVVVTQAVTDITATTATLHATVNPGGSPATVEFFSVIEPGEALSLGTVEVPPGTSDVVVSKAVTGLAPHTAFKIRAVITNDGSGVQSEIVNFSTANTAPVAGTDEAVYAGISLVIEPLANDTDADGDALTLVSANTSGGTVAVNGGTLTFTPDATFEGKTLITYVITDGITQADGQVFVRSALPTTLGRVAAGDVAVAPPAHSNVEAFPDGSLWASFGVPSIMDQGRSIGWLGKVTTPAGVVSGIFSGNNANAPRLRAKVGSVATDAVGAPMQGVSFAAFREPVFGANGNTNGDAYAFYARVKGTGTTRQNDEGIWVSGASGPVLIAREGSAAPDVTGGKFSSFISLSMPEGSGVFLVATLRQGGSVKAGNDLGLWVWTAEKGLRLALREGDLVSVNGTERKVKSFKVLTAVPGSLGHSRTSATNSSVYGSISFTDKSQAVVSIDNDAELELQALTDVPHPRGAVPVAFGIPDVKPEGGTPVVKATLKTGIAGVTSATDLAILDYQGGIIAQEGQAAPGVDGAAFQSFLDPVCGSGPEEQSIAAFIATVINRTGSPKKLTGIWKQIPDATADSPALQTVALQGEQAPGTEGYFDAFRSLAIVEGRGPVFTASLRRVRKEITAANDLGLWATDSTGAVRLLAREGDEVIVSGETKVLKSFEVLGAVSGSPGQGRAVSPGDELARVIYRASYTDGAQQIVTVSIP